MPDIIIDPEPVVDNPPPEVYHPSSEDPSSSNPSSSSSSSKSNSDEPTYNFNVVQKRAQKLLHKVWDDIDFSDLHKTQNALATSFAVYSFFPLVVVLYNIWKRVKRWADNELATSVQLHHAQVTEENKRAALGKVAKVLPILFLLTQILWIVFYVTEAIATRGGIITTFDQYRFTLAQRYLSFSLADLSLLAMLLYLVNFRLTTLEKILLALCTLVVITVYGLMNSISPPPDSSFDSFSDSTSSEDTIANVAMILRHIETGFYVILAYLVCRTIGRLNIALVSENKVHNPVCSFYISQLFFPETQTRIHLHRLSFCLQNF
jgi:hypothetical protein